MVVKSKRLAKEMERIVMMGEKKKRSHLNQDGIRGRIHNLNRTIITIQQMFVILVGMLLKRKVEGIIGQPHSITVLGGKKSDDNNLPKSNYERKLSVIVLFSMLTIEY